MSVINEAIMKAVVYSPARRELKTGTYLWQIATLYTWGVHGTGKTARAERLGHSLGFDFVYIINPNNMSDPGDVGGMPKFEENYFRRVPPHWAILANQAKRALIIIDEIGDAPPAIQAALQRVINERWVGDYKLGGHVRFLCFGNPPEISTMGFDLSMPMANRGGHMEISWDMADTKTWREWLLQDGGMKFEVEALDGEAEEKRVLARWSSDYAWARGVMSSFVNSTHTIIEIPKPESPEASRAHPTPRSMVFATQALAAARCHKLSDEDRDALMTAFIGSKAMTVFKEWFEEQNIPELEDVLSGKVKWKHDPYRPDITLMVLDGSASLVTGGGLPKDTATSYAIRLWKILKETMAMEQVDLIWTSVDTLAAGGFRRACPEARDVLGAIRDEYKDIREAGAA